MESVNYITYFNYGVEIPSELRISKRQPEIARDCTGCGLVWFAFICVALIAGCVAGINALIPNLKNTDSVTLIISILSLLIALFGSVGTIILFKCSNCQCCRHSRCQCINDDVEAVDNAYMRL
jgi:hypothetical protein